MEFHQVGGTEWQQDKGVGDSSKGMVWVKDCGLVRAGNKQVWGAGAVRKPRGQWDAVST